MKLFLMRHSKSCANHLREVGATNDQELRDPGLSAVGAAAAASYGPVLRKRLLRLGFDVDDAVIGSSALRRARDTAHLVFGKQPLVLPHFTEHGHIPENTPEKGRYAVPNWPALFRHICTMRAESLAIVGHGSFLTSLWPTFTGKARGQKLKNLDGILLEITDGKIHVIKEIRGPPMAGPDRCLVRDTRKLSALNRMGAAHSRARTLKAKAAKAKTAKRKNKRRTQRGGNSLPYYAPHRMEQYGAAAGVDKTEPSAAWARPALSATTVR